MIDGYKFRDGKVIVVDYDENNVKTEIERKYQDNIGELLVAEVINDHLNGLKDEVIGDIHTKEESIKDCKNDMVPLIGTILYGTFGVGSLLGIGILGSFGLNTMFSFGLTFLGICIVLCSTLVVPKVIKIKNLNKEIKVLNVTLEGIEEEIKKNQKELRRLENDDKVLKEDISCDYVQLDCEDKLEEIDNNLKLWHYVGVNEEDCLYWHKQDVLDEVLVEDKVLTLDDVKTLKRIVASRVKKR